MSYLTSSQLGILNIEYLTSSEFPLLAPFAVCSFDIKRKKRRLFNLSCIYVCSSLREVGGIKHPSLSSKKLLDSGFKYKYGLEEMFDGAIECCKQKGLL